MFSFGWGALAAQAGLPINEELAPTPEHLAALAQSACALVMLYDAVELKLSGPGPLWAYLGIVIALRDQGVLHTLIYIESGSGTPLCIFSGANVRKA